MRFQCLTNTIFSQLWLCFCLIAWFVFAEGFWGAILSIMHCASSQKQKHTKTVPHLVPKHTTHEDTGNDCLYCCQAMSKHGCLIFFVPFHGKLRTVRLETDAKAYLKTFSAHHFWLELNIDFLFKHVQRPETSSPSPQCPGRLYRITASNTKDLSSVFHAYMKKRCCPHFFRAFPKKASNCTTSNWRQGLTQNIFCTSLLIRIYYTFPVQHVQPPLELLQSGPCNQHILYNC